jgi:Zn-dependent M28 family amino/carboxypeptidase
MSLAQAVHARVPESNFDAERAFGYLRQQVAFGPRVPGSAAHEQTRALILRTLSECGFTTSVQEFEAYAPAMKQVVRGFNLIGIYPPGSRAHVILSAHYDTRCIAELDPNPARRELPILGANDGASGVAVLLELARVIHQRKALNTPIALVFFDLEDQGLGADSRGFCLGSRYLAANLPPALIDFEIGINLDMVGDAQLTLPYEAFSFQAAPELVEAIWEIGAQVDSAVFVKRKGPAVYDDHVPFLEKKKKYINIIDFDYPQWHTSDDCVEKCSPRSLKTCGDTLLQFLYQQ